MHSTGLGGARRTRQTTITEFASSTRRQFTANHTGRVVLWNDVLDHLLANASAMQLERNAEIVSALRPLFVNAPWVTHDHLHEILSRLAAGSSDRLGSGVHTG